MNEHCDYNFILWLATLPLLVMKQQKQKVCALVKGSLSDKAACWNQLKLFFKSLQLCYATWG